MKDRNPSRVSFVSSNGRIKTIALAGLVACGSLLANLGCRGFVAKKDYQAFRGSLGHTSVTVFPAVVRVGENVTYDHSAVAAIAEMIRTEQLATVEHGGDEVKITRGWHGNQAKMLRESSEDLTGHVVAHPIKTDYAILPEYLGRPGVFGGIQCNVVDKHGKPAFALVMNSHNVAFARKAPKSASDCTEVLLESLQEHLVKGR